MGELEGFKWKGSKLLTPQLNKELNEYGFKFVGSIKKFNEVGTVEEGVALLKGNKLVRLEKWASNVLWKQQFVKTMKKYGIKLKRAQLTYMWG